MYYLQQQNRKLHKQSHLISWVIRYKNTHQSKKRCTYKIRVKFDIKSSNICLNTSGSKNVTIFLNIGQYNDVHNYIASLLFSA